ncbi:hypothetical protein [Nocardiopsis synnemataformans]|uniref:hypothetical protein n=1 Tax=Nocardiopsis synnemataformans TaxID=61305 RepID=UPI003EBA9C79
MSPGPDPRNQQPLDENFTVLIVPDAIPIPGTSVEILQTAVAAMRAAAGEVAEGGEGIESTWQGLQPHYTAPESEILLAVMGPVAAKGETILDDTATVADALDTFAEAAQTAKSRLRTLKEEAVAFSTAMNNFEVMGKEVDFWNLDLGNYLRNRELKLQVNAEWSAFQEAERTCANAISAVTGSGNNYVSVSQAGDAPSPGEIVYGLDPDDVADVDYDFSEFSDWQRVGGDMWDHFSHSDKPWPLDWAVDAVVAQQENFGVGMLWGLGVGAVSATGLWREGSGWATSVGEVVDNAVTHKEETFQGYGALVGLYGEDGWMNPFDADERSGQTWQDNAGAAWTEVAHDIVPWREWEERPAYTVSTAAGNAALAVVSLPVRGGAILANLGRGGSDLPDLDPVDRPEVVWEPGAAARTGFTLSETFSGIRGDFSDTTSGFGSRLGSLSGMIERLSAGSPGEGGGSGSGRGPNVPVSGSDPDLPNPRRPVSVPGAGDSSGDPDRSSREDGPLVAFADDPGSEDPSRRGGEDEHEVLAAADQPDPPRRGDEDRPSRAPHHLDVPSTERWPEMEEFLDSEHRREDDERSVADRDSENSGTDSHRPLSVIAADGSDTASGDGLHSTLDLDAREIEREYEREVERTTQHVVDMVEEFRALPAERQLEWLRVNQLVGANAAGGPQNSGFGSPGNDGFEITASHDPNSGNGGGPPRTPQDGTSNTGFTPGSDGNTGSGDTTGSRPIPEDGGGRGRQEQGSLPAWNDDFSKPGNDPTISEDAKELQPGQEPHVFDSDRENNAYSGDAHSSNGTAPEGTLVAPDAVGDLPKLMPKDFTRGHILEQVIESRVGRNEDGLIETVDGVSATDYLKELIDQRVLDTGTLRDRTNLTKGDLGKDGAVQSVVLDRRTGNIIEAVNGLQDDVIKKERLHPLLSARLDKLYEGGPYTLYQREQPWKEHSTRMNDEPLRHAEIKAVNELLWLRGGRETDVSVFRELQLDNRFTFRKRNNLAPCCPNCTDLIPDVRNPTAGRRIEGVQGMKYNIEHDE